MKVSRRTFLASVGACGVLFPATRIFLGRCSSPREFSPIDRSGTIQGGFVGDQPGAAHKALWNIESHLAANPNIDESVELAIIGGGMSGLCSAYALKKFKPVVFEQAARLGGNSKGATWNGVDYPLGAVYFSQPEKGSQLFQLLKTIGVDTKPKIAIDTIALRNKLYPNYVNDFPSLARLAKFLEEIASGRLGVEYPIIPGDLSKLKALDSTSLGHFFKKHLGSDWDDLAQTAVEYYCWSSFGASQNELSAASGINFLAGETGGICTEPGGNASIAQKLCQNLLGTTDFRMNTAVLRIEKVSRGVKISYLAADGKCRAMEAKRVVVAAPKFVARKIVSGLAPDQLQAMSSISYRAYLVAHVYLKRRPPADYFDVYALDDGKLQNNIEKESARATDIVFANFGGATLGAGVLCLYRAFPFEGARAKILPEESFGRYQAEFKAQIENEILPLFEFRKEDVAGIGVSRWGHAMPVSSVGCYSDGRIPLIRKSIDDKIFFANQDNWLLPAFETCALEAFSVAKVILNS